MKTLPCITITLLMLCRFAGAVELATPAQWMAELEKKSFPETLSFTLDHKQEWPVLRSPSWIERQPEDVRTAHKDDLALSVLILGKLHGAAVGNFAVQETRSQLTANLLSMADAYKAKGGHNNDVLALACEKIAVHLALVHLNANPSDAKQFTAAFVTGPDKHIQTKAWLKQRGNEDAWLHDKMARIDTITQGDEQSPFGVFFRLAQGAEVPKPPAFSFRSLIDTSNVVRLWFDSVNAEYERTVALPLVIDYLVAGGIAVPRPANPTQAVREKLGKDMSKYRHQLIRQGDASPNDIWSTLNRVYNEKAAFEMLTRWLE